MDSKIIRIDDINDERVLLFTGYNEPELFHFFEPEPGIFIAETPTVIERALVFGARPLSFFIEEGSYKKDIVRALLERSPGVPVYEAELDVINRITGFNLTRGVLAAFKRPPLPDVDSLLSKKRIAVLEGIVNPTNLGAIFRSASALGAGAIFITPDSTDPFYRRSARVSMGTVFQIPWTYFPKGCDYTEILHAHGYTIVCMALTDNAVPITELNFEENEKIAIVFGSEGDGISKETLAKSDHIAIIPMHGGVDSLNVAASSAVAFWELCKKTE